MFIRNNYASVLLQEEVFSTPVSGLTVYVESRKKGGYLEGILVHDSRDPASPVTYLAKKGKLEKTENGPQIILMDADAQKLNIKTHNLEVLYFDNYPLNLSTYIDESGIRTREAEELFLPELLYPPKNLPDAQKAKLIAEGHNRIIWPFYAVTMTLIAMAGLLFGPFNRRGHWKKNVVIAVSGLVMLTSGLLAKGIASAHLGMAWIMYIPVTFFTGGAIYIMLIYRYPDYYKLRKKALKLYVKLRNSRSPS
jgi:lipopolysaccharide export system permease protein